MLSSGSVRAVARAKVNLSLEVLGRRGDGYHDLATVFHTIDLADTLDVCPSDDSDIRLTVAGLDLPGPPSDNLVVRAATRLRAATGTRHGASIRLTKRIPVAAGLGGGSADAAAALVALNAAWSCGLDRSALLGLAADLGSDVPFCLLGGAALGEGRGERLTPLPPLRGTRLVLLPLAAELPDKTRRLYGALTPDDWSDGGRTHALADALRAGHPIHQPGPNAFEPAARELLPGVEAALRACDVAAGPGRAGVSGSGPSVFVPVEREAEAATVVAALGRLGYNAVAARPSARGAELVAGGDAGGA